MCSTCCSFRCFLFCFTLFTIAKIRREKKEVTSCNGLSLFADSESVLYENYSENKINLKKYGKISETLQITQEVADTFKFPKLVQILVTGWEKKSSRKFGGTSSELNSRDIWSFEVQMKISLIPPNINELGRELHRKEYFNKFLSNFTWYRDLVLDVVDMMASFQTSDSVYLATEFGKLVCCQI